tara:strand:- start:3047 stop:3691 length:645 start_codon:yes stop_codon:yes gene_type:complete
MDFSLIEDESADFLIVSGDFCNSYNEIDYVKLKHKFNYLSKRFNYIVFTLGNHDSYILNNLSDFKSSIPSNCYLLINSFLEIGGLTFWGSPNSLRFYDKGAFSCDEEELSNIYKNIPNNLDFLITHTPPYSILDSARGNFSGSKALLKSVKDKKPRIHSFGHIHDSSGVFTNNDTMFINSAVDSLNFNNNQGPVRLCYSLKLRKVLFYSFLLGE